MNIQIRTIGVLVVIAVTFLFGGVVSAEDPDSGGSQDEPSRVFTHSGNGIEAGATVTQSASDEVWTCYIDLDNPHYSHHAEEDRINVAGGVECDQLMEVLEVRMTLWKRTCIWFVCAWDMIGDSGWRIYPATDYADVNAAGPCVANTTSRYYGRLNARFTWPNGDVSDGFNTSPNVDVLCARRQ